MRIRSILGGVWYNKGKMKALPCENTYKEDVCAPHYGQWEGVGPIWGR